MKKILLLAQAVEARKEKNKMTFTNLAITIGINLFPPAGFEELPKQQRLVEQIFQTKLD